MLTLIKTFQRVISKDKLYLIQLNICIKYVMLFYVKVTVIKITLVSQDALIGDKTRKILGLMCLIRPYFIGC